MLKFNNVNVKPHPKKFKVSLRDIDSEKSVRVASGRLTRDRIAKGKRTIDIEFPPLTDAQISNILRLVQDEFFLVEYPDPFTGGPLTKTFYVGDRDAPLYNFSKGLWESLSFSLIER